MIVSTKTKYNHVHCSTSLSWLVLNSDTGTKTTKDNTASIALRFDKVRIVQTDDNQFMACPCGYCQRYLLPCRPVYNLLNGI